MGKKRRRPSYDQTTAPEGSAKRLHSEDLLGEPAAGGPDRGTQKAPKPFKCSVCSKQYVLEGALRTHLLTKHPQLSTSQQTATETSTSVGNDTDELDSEPILERIEYEVKDEPEGETGQGLLLTGLDQEEVLAEPKIEVEEVKVFRIPGDSTSPFGDNDNVDSSVTFNIAVTTTAINPGATDDVEDSQILAAGGNASQLVDEPVDDARMARNDPSTGPNKIVDDRAAAVPTESSDMDSERNPMPIFLEKGSEPEVESGECLPLSTGSGRKEKEVLPGESLIQGLGHDSLCEDEEANGALPSEGVVDKKGSSHSSVEVIAGTELQAFDDAVAFQNTADNHNHDRDVESASESEAEVGRENANMPPVCTPDKDASRMDKNSFTDDDIGVGVVESGKLDAVKDRTTFVNPSGRSSYRREFAKLLLSTTKAGEVLLNRFGMEFDSLMTAMLSIDAGAEHSNDESRMGQDVQTVSEKGSNRKRNISQSSVSPSTSDSSVPPHSTMEKDAMWTTEAKVGSQRSSKVKSNGCDTADESGNEGSGEPMDTHDDEQATELDKDARIEELQKKLQESHKEIERLQKELHEKENENRKEEAGFVAQQNQQHVSDIGENEPGQNSDVDMVGALTAVGPKKLSLVIDEGGGAAADQNEDSADEDQVCDVEALRDAAKERRSVSVVSSLTQLGAKWKALGDHKSSLLHVAARFGNLESLGFLLELGGFDVNGTDGDGDTPLHCAVYHEGNEGVLEMCKLLVEKGANLYAKNQTAYKDTFLHKYVCKEPRLTPSEFHSMAAYLVENGHTRIFSVANVDGNTPLHLAVQCFEPEERTLRLLHSSGVNFNAVNKDGDTILSLAARAKRTPQFLEALVTRFSVKLTKLDWMRNSLLHYVSWLYSSETLKSFLELRMEDLDVNGKNWDGNTPLHLILQNSKTEVLEKCKLLLSYGADINSLNEWKQTTLHCAAESVSDEDVAVEIIKFLIELGVDPLAKDMDDYTFLHHYLLRKNVGPSKLHLLVEFLLEKHPSKIFDTPGKDRKTPLHLIVQNLEPDIKTLLLLKESGSANFNAADNYGNSVPHLAIIGKRSTELLANLVNQLGSNPKLLNNQKESILHTAAYVGTADALKFCCQHRLNINGKTKFGQTPLHFAVHTKSRTIDLFEKCRLLVSKGANVRTANKDGFTPLTFVIKYYEGADKNELFRLLNKTRR